MLHDSILNCLVIFGLVVLAIIFIVRANIINPRTERANGHTVSERVMCWHDKESAHRIRTRQIR